MISTGALLIAVFDGRVGHIAEFVRQAGLTRSQALRPSQTLRQGQAITSQDAETGADVLAKYTRDLTQLARQGKLDPVIGREEEIGQVIQTLSRRENNNRLLIGEAGVGKTVIVERVAQRIVDADVPDTLLNKRVLSLDMAEIFACPTKRSTCWTKRAKAGPRQEGAFNNQDFQKAAEIQMEMLKLEQRLKPARQDWEADRGAIDLLVTEQDVAEVVSEWTGIPVARMVEAEAEKLSRMEENLHRRIAGQDDAVRSVANAIRRSRAGITSVRRPIGSFLFPGLTGVGKTELARALAAFLLDDKSRIVRLDMSEYMERHEVSKMIGAPPGYIGYGEGGQLTEKVRRNPYTVVLLDEIEKAHPDVFNMLLQILEDERMTVREIALAVDEEVIEKLAQDGFDPVWGARPLRREVEHQVENPSS